MKKEKRRPSKREWNYETVKEEAYHRERRQADFQVDLHCPCPSPSSTSAPLCQQRIPSTKSFPSLLSTSRSHQSHLPIDLLRGRGSKEFNNHDHGL